MPIKGDFMAMDFAPEIKPDMGLDMPESYKSGRDEKNSCVCKNNKAVKTFIVALVVIVVLLAVGYYVDRYTSVSLFGNQKSAGSALMSYNKDSYYAVFFSNGQVYFGKITSTDSNYTTLEDIYYLQVSNPLQQVPPPGGTQQQQLSLVKLGNELHGPKDFMQVNNAHVIFVEELKSDSKVVEAITAYKSGATNQPAQ